MANLLNLPSEILLQILFCLVTPVPLSQQPFWLLVITPDALLLPSSSAVEQSEQRGMQARMATTLSLVSRRAWAVFTPFMWSSFDCSKPVALVDLSRACASERELGSYIQ